MSHKSHFSSFCLFSCVTEGKEVHGRVSGRDGGDEVLRDLIETLSLYSSFNENLDFIVDPLSCPLGTYWNNFLKTVFPEIITLCVLLGISVLISI